MASPENESGIRWIPLVEYAVKKDVSLSTLRRHIKAGKIQYRVEHGRYLLRDDETTGARTDPRAAPLRTASSSAVASAVAPAAITAPVAQSEPEGQVLVAKLKSDLRKAQEEIAELKMLIALYEEKMPGQRLDA